jgi:hypothetical protein
VKGKGHAKAGAELGETSQTATGKRGGRGKGKGKLLQWSTRRGDWERLNCLYCLYLRFLF